MARNSPGINRERYYSPARADRGFGSKSERDVRRDFKISRKMREEGVGRKVNKKEAKKLRDYGVRMKDIEGRGLKISRGADRVYGNYPMERRRSKPKPPPQPKYEEPEIDDFDIDYGDYGFNDNPAPDEGLQAFNPVQPTNLSLYQEPVTIGNPAKKKQQGGLGQFKSINPGLKISSKLLNI